MHYSGPGTDLDDRTRRRPASGKAVSATAKNGVTCNPEIFRPEEVFTTPHARRVQGRVASTKPLSYQGTLIDDIAVRFEEGRIVRGEGVARRGGAEQGARHRRGRPPAWRSGAGAAFLTDLEERARCSSTRFSTKNAACHIALGQCYSKCFVDGAKLSPDEIAAREVAMGKSFIHIELDDRLDKIDIDGIRADGGRTPVFRKGEWA